MGSRLSRSRGSARTFEDTEIERDHQEYTIRGTARRPEDKTLHGSLRSKKSRRGPRHILGLWARVALLVVFILALGFMAVRLVAKIIHPYREAGAQTQQLESAKKQVVALNEQNAILNQKIAYLKTPSGMVQEARKMGYVRPGEVPFVVEGLMPSSTLSTTQKPKPTTVVPQTQAARLWHRLIGH